MKNSNYYFAPPPVISQLLHTRILSIIVCFVLFSNSLSFAQLTCETPEPSTSPSIVDCSLIGDLQAGRLPEITVNVAVHFIGIGNGNFYDGDVGDNNALNGTQQAKSMIEKSNEMLSDIVDNPVQAIDFIGDSKIRFQIYSNYEDGVFFWDNINDYQAVPDVINIMMIDESPSHFHGLACGLDSDCDWVRIWGWYTNQTTTQKWKYWNYARLLNHEIFHVLGLRHSFSSWGECNGIDIDHTLESGGWTGSTKNTMAYNVYQSALSPCQWSHIYSNLHDGHFSFSEVACQSADTDPILITQDETWVNKRVIYGNVVIEEDVTLTITCDVELAEDSRILLEQGAKLIVTGAKLSNIENCGYTTWKGIKVNGGGNSDFDVLLTNNTEIVNARTAVSMAPWGLTWPAHQTNANGILLADNTTFTNCNRVAAFISYAPQFNVSVISNCTINGGTDAITNWNCQGIVLENNEFNGMLRSGVLTIDGSFEISDNEFNSSDVGILFMKSANGFSSNVFDNDFYGPTGVRGDGASMATNHYQYNTFDCDDKALDMVGDNFFDVKNNDITNSLFGVYSVNSGGHENKVDLNSFIQNQVGNHLEGTNTNYKFKSNCFYTTLEDVRIDGNIAFFQGSHVKEAGNCFSSPHGRDLHYVSGNNFRYYLYPDEETNCKDIQSNTGGFTIFSSVGEADDYESCGFKTPPVEGSDWDIIEGKSIVELTIERVALLAEISVLESSNPGNESQISSLNSDLYRLTRYIIQRNMKISDFTNARLLIDPAVSDDAKLLWFSTYIIEQDYSTASSYINGLTNLSTDMQDFKTVQLMNISRLTQGPNYIPTSSELSNLLLIAQKVHPYAAYARGLHYLLTDEIIEFPFNLPTVPHSSNNTAQENGINIYPNPVISELNISINDIDTEDVIIEIRDIMGNTVYQNDRIISSVQISTSLWNTGVYFVKIQKANLLLKQEKIVLVK